MVMLAGELVPGFHIESFKWALLFSLIYPVIRFILDLPEKIRSKQIYIKVQRKKDNEDFPDDFEDGID